MATRLSRHVGSIAFGCDTAIAQQVLALTPGTERIRLVATHPCVEFPMLTTHLVSDEDVREPANYDDEAVMDRVEAALSNNLTIGILHRCMG